MQGNKKCTDGFSDSSSIGSVLDEADREVSSLTDRAFRSLCISEDTSFNDSDLALSPDISRQVFGNFHQEMASHTHRKSGIWTQLPSQGTEHAGWAATFQQQPKYVQGEEKYPKSSPPLTPVQRRLEMPVSGLRSNKPGSKVSSLIKSFDGAESQRCDSRPPTSKPPSFKNPPKFAPLPESGVNFCFDSAFLTVRRVPAEVSSTHQNSHQSGRNPGEQEPPNNPDLACHSSSSFLPTPEDAANSFKSRFPSPPHKPVTSEPGRGKEWVHKGTFLHSENSAFESWNAHQPRLLERKDVTDAVPESKASKHYEDTASLREHHVPEHKVSPCQVRISCSQEENRLVGGAVSTSGTWGPRDPGAQVFTMEGKASSCQPEPQMKSTQVPWRKPKTGKGGQRGKENLQDVSDEKKQTNRRSSGLYSKHNPQGQFPENDVLEMPADPNEHYSPPFNISKLLTPIIPTKHILDSSDSLPKELSPSPPGQINGYQEKEPSEGQSRDSYKSKAPSLLFNLKDVRKCVKSTYCPSPLLKGLNEKTRSKQEPMSNGVILPNGCEESPPGELSKKRPADAPSGSHASTQKDPKQANPTASSTDNSRTLRSPPTPAKAPFCVNGEPADGNSYEKDDTDGESDVGATRSSGCPDSREHCARKHLSQQLCSREPEAGKTAEEPKVPGLENGFLRSVSQEIEPEREAGLQDPNFNQKFSPGPLSPEEEDVFYSDSQSDFVPGLKSKAKFSTSSSDQSFASFEDQQKTWFTEDQREDRRNDVGAGDSEKDQENVMGTDELQHQALSNGDACTEELSQGGLLPGEGERLSGGRPRRASREEDHFRGSWMGRSKDTALSYAKDFTPSPSSALNKHKLFAIKDNTLRATPVIKPIMLPLLRTMSSEDPLGSGHKEGELPRPSWGEDTDLCISESQVRRSTQTPASRQGTHLKQVGGGGMEDLGQVPSMVRTETSQPALKGNVPFPPFLEGGEGMKPPPEATWEGVVSDGKSSFTEEGRTDAPRCIPTIALPEDDLEENPLPQQLGACWEEQVQDFKSHFLSTPRAGFQGRRLVPSETAASPNSSSLDESSACSPAASCMWDNASQAPGELGQLSGDPAHRSPWASPGPARVTRREDLTHALSWETGCDPLLEPSGEDFRTLSPRSSLLDVATSLSGLPEKVEPPTQLERAAGKPPAVPPKTEKALRRAKKLASKRRKTDQMQEKRGEPREEKPHPEDSEYRPPSPTERPQPRFPAVRSLPPPVHRHSVSAFSEPIRGQPGDSQSFTPPPPYPATQKILQDPQSGEYFVFDLPLQVKIKTFYDPETGKYIQVSIPSSEAGSPELPPPDTLAAPYVLYPGFQALPVTALTPLHCSSQLSAPTFLRQGPLDREAAHSGSQRAHHTGLLPVPGPHGDPTQHPAVECPEGPPQSPGEEGGSAANLGIISTNDLEDFATEGIS